MPEARATNVSGDCIGKQPPTPAQTLLGFDFGAHRIDVAVGQRITGTASAMTTLAARDGQPDWTQVAQLIATWQPDALVVGLPLQLDGSRSTVTEAAERFARRLEGRFRLPVYLYDERLSSHAAEHWSSEHTRRGSLDEVAAQIILQDWLDGQGEH
ncbi:MAG: Holliday junction resolvase RuvX [Gammaproteobacteria bacterium]|nr:Holliday junction resolvase RuvX [Gammaproteobacteria bacterium]